MIPEILEMTFDVGYDTDLKSCVELLKKIFTEDAYVVDKENHHLCERHG